MRLANEIFKYFKLSLYKIKNLLSSIEYNNERKATENRLNMYIRNENRAIRENYLKLGKYYYENKRENNDENQDKLCESIDKSKSIIEENENMIVKLNS